MKIQYIDPITRKTETIDHVRSIVEATHWDMPNGWFEIQASQDEGGLRLIPSTTDIFVFGVK